MPDIDPIQSFLGAFGQMQGLMQNRRRMKNEEAQQAALEQFRQKQLEQQAAKSGQEDLYKQAELEGKYGKRISNGLIQDIPGFQKPESEMDKLGTALKGLQITKAQQDIQQNQRQAKEASLGKDTERQAATFAKRMKESEEQYGGLMGKGYEPSMIKDSGYFPDILKGSDQRQAENAKRNFISAVLRKESGAAISPTEFSEANKLYFEQAGDDAAVKAQKAQARADALEGMKLQAGPAQGLITNKVAPQKEEIEDGYQYVGPGPKSDPKSWKKVK